MKVKHPLLFWLIALLVIAFAIFGQSIGFGFVPYDDPAYVVNNGYVNKGVSAEGLKWAFFYTEGSQSLGHRGVTNLWHPLTFISHMLDVSLFGLHGTWGHHLINVLLHGIAAIFLILLAHRLTGSAPAAFCVALLWMIHPLKVESVAWISERKDVLSGMFFWASLWVLKAKDQENLLWKRSSWALFVLAVLAKPSAVVLPMLLILVEGLEKKERSWGKNFWLAGLDRYKWWFATSLMLALITVTLQTKGSHAYFAEQSSLLGRMAPQAFAMFFYLWRTLAPWDLNIHYPYPKLGFTLTLLTWFALLSIIAFIIKYRRKFPQLFFAAAWWAVCLAPVSGIFYLGSSFTSDRYLYLALAGPLLAIFSLQKNNHLTKITFVLVALTWGILSFLQTGVWKNGWTLFKHATKAQPKSALGWTNLGTQNFQAGNSAKAVVLFQKALEVEPRNHITWHNLGKASAGSNDSAAAQKAYREALHHYPNNLPSLRNLGLLLFQEEKAAEAGALFKQACQLTRNREPIVLWMFCQTEIAQGNLASARTALKLLEALPIRNEEILKKMPKARAFLDNSE